MSQVAVKRVLEPQEALLQHQSLRFRSLQNYVPQRSPPPKKSRHFDCDFHYRDAISAMLLNQLQSTAYAHLPVLHAP